MPSLRTCRVQFRDVEGTIHSVDVTAETLFEAAALALRTFAAEPWAASIPPTAMLDISVTAPVVQHSVSVEAVRRWLTAPPRSPQEALRKQRLREVSPDPSASQRAT